VSAEGWRGRLCCARGALHAQEARRGNPDGDYKPVSDLGIAAYLLMHGFRVAGRKGRIVYFEVAEKDEQEFEKLNFEYLSSTYHSFDSCLLLLKKVGEYTPPGVS
jgi:hypothetical protein